MEVNFNRKRFAEKALAFSCLAWAARVLNPLSTPCLSALEPIQHLEGCLLPLGHLFTPDFKACSAQSHPNKVLRISFMSCELSPRSLSQDWFDYRWNKLAKMFKLIKIVFFCFLGPKHILWRPNKDTGTVKNWTFIKNLMSILMWCRLGVSFRLLKPKRPLKLIEFLICKDFFTEGIPEHGLFAFISKVSWITTLAKIYNSARGDVVQGFELIQSM